MVITNMSRGFYYDNIGDADGTNELIVDLGETRTPVAVMFCNVGAAHSSTYIGDAHIRVGDD